MVRPARSRNVLPLDIPPGRNGLQPDVTLDYNSQRTQDSIVGYGWQLSIPYIQRSQQDWFAKSLRQHHALLHLFVRWRISKYINDIFGHRKFKPH